MPKTPGVPAYRLHKPSGQAVVRLSGRDHYLGRHGTGESRAEYDRVVAGWLTVRRSATLGGPRSGPPADLTIVELVDGFLTWADGYYLKNGRLTGELTNLQESAKPLVRLCTGPPSLPSSGRAASRRSGRR